MGRRAVVDALNELAFCVELLGLSPEEGGIDPKSTSGLAWAIRSMQPPPEGQGTIEDAILRLPDMTPRLAAVVDDALHDRSPPFLDELKRQLPIGLLQLRRIKGLGPKKIIKLWKELGIESLGELEYACKENRLVTLDGFGDKTQKAVLEQLAAARDEQGLLRRDHAENLASLLVEMTKSKDAKWLLAGEYRRGCELISEVVVVTTGPAPDALPPRVRFVSSVPVKTFGTQLLLATGSDAHLDALRAHASKQGKKLEDVEAAEEDDVYAALGLWPVAPEHREAGTILVEKAKARPKTLQKSDLRGSLHNHTTASDGNATLDEMAYAAAKWGLEWIGITDHSESAGYAHGLDAKRLREQHAEIQQQNQQKQKDRSYVFSGVESDILRDGALDYPDDVLFALDVVVASMHQRYGLKGPSLTERLVKAARHKSVDVVGHPTGRLLLSRPAAEFDISALLEACKANGCAIELNANPARLDLSEKHLREAKERGVLVSIAADAHAVDELPYLDHGLALARRAGLTAEDVLNSRSVDEVKAWVKARRAAA